MLVSTVWLVPGTMSVCAARVMLYEPTVKLSYDVEIIVGGTVDGLITVVC